MAVTAFWIALAAVLIAGSWRKKAVEQMRHETVRLLIQQGRDLNEEEVRNLIETTIGLVLTLLVTVPVLVVNRQKLL